MATNMRAFNANSWKSGVGYTAPFSGVIEDVRAKMEVASKPVEEIEDEVGESKELPEHACLYCGIHNPASVALCAPGEALIRHFFVAVADAVATYRLATADAFGVEEVVADMQPVQRSRRTLGWQILPPDERGEGLRYVPRTQHLGACLRHL